MNSTVNSWVENAAQTHTHNTHRLVQNVMTIAHCAWCLVWHTFFLVSNCITEHPLVSTPNWMLSHSHFFTFDFLFAFGRCHRCAPAHIFSLSLRLIWWPCNVEKSSENICSYACVYEFDSIRSNFFVTVTLIEWIRKRKRRLDAYENEPAKANRKKKKKQTFHIWSLWFAAMQPHWKSYSVAFCVVRLQATQAPLHWTLVYWIRWRRPTKRAEWLIASVSTLLLWYWPSPADFLAQFTARFIFCTCSFIQYAMPPEQKRKSYINIFNQFNRDDTSHGTDHRQLHDEY